MLTMHNLYANVLKFVVIPTKSFVTPVFLNIEIARSCSIQILGILLYDTFETNTFFDYERQTIKPKK